MPALFLFSLLCSTHRPSNFLSKMPSSQAYRNAKGRGKISHLSRCVTQQQRITGQLKVLMSDPTLKPLSNARSVPSKRRPHAKWRSLYEKVFTGWWLWEILAIVLGASSFVVLIILLSVCDGHAVPRLPLRISLNGIVSILTTVSKTSMLFSITATISQFKGLTFSGWTRQLKDLQIYDEASRGPLGASRLLISSKGR